MKFLVRESGSKTWTVVESFCVAEACERFAYQRNYTGDLVEFSIPRSAVHPVGARRITWIDGRCVSELADMPCPDDPTIATQIDEFDAACRGESLTDADRLAIANARADLHYRFMDGVSDCLDMCEVEQHVARWRRECERKREEGWVK